MKNPTRLLLSTALLSLPCLATASELRIYQLDLRGPAPALADFRSALDEKGMPGLVIYSAPVQPDGQVVIDQTRHDVLSPDISAKEPRRLGVLLQGKLTPADGKEPTRRISFSIRDCKHTAYIFSSGSKKFHASWTESSREVNGKIDADGWCLIDTDPDSQDPRQVFVVQVTL